MTDYLNTVRDIAKCDPGTDTTTVVNHQVYDAFGNVTSETAPAVDSLFLFTARPFDPDTGLQNNLNRWYDPRVGRWLSEDPIGFAASDGSFYRYCWNAPIVGVGSSGTDYPPPGGWIPRPRPSPGSEGQNARRTGGIGYMWPFTECCSRFAHHNSGFPGPLPPGIKLDRGPETGYYKVSPYPADPPPELREIWRGPARSARLRGKVALESIERRRKDAMVILHILLSHKRNLADDDGYGATALFAAVDHNKVSIAGTLLKFGANPNVRVQPRIDGPGDLSPLHVAFDSEELVQLLLDHGADASAKDSQGRTPADYIASNENRTFDLVKSSLGWRIRPRCAAGIDARRAKGEGSGQTDSHHN